MLKLLTKDRRVDKGVKYSPVFGRYGFLMGGDEEETEQKVIRVGDRVRVIKRIAERDRYEWPGLADGT